MGFLHVNYHKMVEYLIIHNDNKHKFNLEYPYVVGQRFFVNGYFIFFFYSTLSMIFLDIFMADLKYQYRMILSSNINNGEFEVQQIVDEAYFSGCTHYLIKWKGYSSLMNTWQPDKHLYNVPESLEIWKTMKKKIAAIEGIEKKKGKNEDEEFKISKYKIKSKIKCVNQKKKKTNKLVSTKFEHQLKQQDKISQKYTNYDQSESKSGHYNNKIFNQTHQLNQNQIMSKKTKKILKKTSKNLKNQQQQKKKIIQDQQKDIKQPEKVIKQKDKFSATIEQNFLDIDNFFNVNVSNFQNHKNTTIQMPQIDDLISNDLNNDIPPLISQSQISNMQLKIKQAEVSNFNNSLSTLQNLHPTHTINSNTIRSIQHMFFWHKIKCFRIILKDGTLTNVKHKDLKQINPQLLCEFYEKFIVYE